MLYKIIKKVIPNKIKHQLKDQLGVPSLSWSLNNLRNIGFSPKMVVDCGAYEGQWALELKSIFPESKILMIEAQKNKTEILAKLCDRHRNFNFKIALLSSVKDQNQTFFESETSSHIYNNEHEANNEQLQVYPTSTLDDILIQSGLPLPNFLKLDVQGHELEVLKGGSMALASAEFCLLELTLIEIGDRVPLMLPVLNFMDDKNFQLYDLTQFMRRPSDKALYQVDALFIKKNSKYISDFKW